SRTARMAEPPRPGWDVLGFTDAGACASRCSSTPATSPCGGRPGAWLGLPSIRNHRWHGTPRIAVDRYQESRLVVDSGRVGLHGQLPIAGRRLGEAGLVLLVVRQRQL